MNDRFKFRVWDKQDGCYAYSNNSDVDVLYIETDGELTYGVYSNDYEDMHYIPESEVIVEQCTGLKDKNGKLIYEGDIVREISKKEPEWEEYVITVKWNNCRFILDRDDEFDFLIIGNIHENADLLENEE